jgi:hypothetical protein
MKRTTNGVGWRGLAAIGSLLAAAGCGHGQLQPAASATKVAGAPGAAAKTKDGVRLSVDVSNWHGVPDDLPDRFTPVKVRIVNRSGKPLRILYEDFAFRTSDGRAYFPLPVVPLDGDGERIGTITPIYAANKFFVADKHKALYPGLIPWPEELERDDGLYRRQFHKWKDLRPTREMRRMGLPEGVLADGGSVSGYLYFEDLTRARRRHVFEAELTDGESGGAVATISIPFSVE